MSNYVAPAFHPKTARIVDAEWLDNYFGPHAYGVRFDGDEKIYKLHECSMLAAADEIARLRADNERLRAAIRWVCGEEADADGRWFHDVRGDDRTPSG